MQKKQWSDAHALGHHGIDDHHEEVFQLVSMLDAAIRSHDREKLGEIIQYLEHYVIAHFEEEEAVMRENDYAGLDEHVAAHAEFRQLVKGIRLVYDDAIHSTHLVYKIRRFVDGLIHHIITVDSRLAEILGKN